MSQICQSVLVDRRGCQTAQMATLSHEFDDGHVIPIHAHPEDQLIYASKGVMTVDTAHGTWVVPPLRAVWIPAGTPHSVAMSGRVSMRTLYMHPRLIRKRSQKCFVMNVSALLRELILHACEIRKLNKKTPAHRRVIEIIVDQLRTTHSIPLQLPHPSDSRAMRVVKVLLANPEMPCTLTALAENCGASTRTIERVFLKETKMTFSQWRQQLRLLRAVQLLASGESVTEAAMTVGYSSVSAFIQMFRRQLGRTPGRCFGA